MKRMKKHKVKREQPEYPTKATSFRSNEETDLTYYIHDRVELMHQVFSILKPKEMKAMAPDCVKNLSTDDLEELCLEELLGISSKRLCAILDGAEPPSDTESSSSEGSDSPHGQGGDQLETISLDSISSDEEDLGSKHSGRSHKKSKKHEKHRKGHRVCKRREARDANAKADDDKMAADKPNEDGNTNSRAAERAGMTVLELLELQARARAIRAQLVLEQSRKADSATKTSDDAKENVSDDGSVEIKEEPQEVVELLSSEDDDLADKKPNLGLVDADPSASKSKSSSSESQTVTKRKNDLTVIVPKTHSRKIKLNRNKVVVSLSTVKDKSADDVQIISVDKTTVAKVPEVPGKSIDTSKPIEVPKDSNISNKKQPIEPIGKTQNVTPNKVNKEAKIKQSKEKLKKPKRKSKPRNRESAIEREGSDHDEITLQLSDSEKMDLLENFDKKNYDDVSSSDSSSSSETTSGDDSDATDKEKPKKGISVSATDCHKKKIQSTVPTLSSKITEDKLQNTVQKVTDNIVLIEEKSVKASNNSFENTIEFSTDSALKITNEGNGTDESHEKSEKSVESIINNTDEKQNQEEIHSVQGSPVQSINCKENQTTNVWECHGTDEQFPKHATVESENLEVVDGKDFEAENERSNVNLETHNFTIQNVQEDSLVILLEKTNEITMEDQILKSNSKDVTADTSEQTFKLQDKVEDAATKPNTGKEFSEGELSDRASSEVEMFNKPDPIVCISDDEDNASQQKGKKKKNKEKKKDKKAKKEKKSKKSKKSDFCEASDQNFFNKKENENYSTEVCTNDNKLHDPDNNLKSPQTTTGTCMNSDDVYEILEISDDSSCYEVEGVSVLSKEPTPEEIEALSAKIESEILREEVVTEEQIRDHEQTQADNNVDSTKLDNLEDISWKDRWLGSTKVKKVMVTSNILNALRKKNKELKKKLEESKIEKGEQTDDNPTTPSIIPQQINPLLEGSIEQYNTLEGSTKYVDPIPEPQENETEDTKETVEKRKNATDLDKEMKKDARQLLKMYKRLLKYNSLEKQVDPNKTKKKKKKKLKKSKESKSSDVKTTVNVAV